MRADAVSRAVLEQLRELHCLEPEQTVCCALSGGADSVCLLRCLLELRPVLGITITAVHVNHHLRGAESERDRAFCQQLCAGLGVRLAVYDVNPAARAAQEHCSEELAARECRYAAFAQVQADWIATAHTASDNLETAVHRLVRGASLHGLTAIPPKNGRFLRPLLRVTRRQVEQYLESLGQTYVTDSTNLTDAYTRNRIRHQVIPALEQLNPSVERTVSYTLRSLRREDDFLHQQAQAAYAKCHTGKNTLSGLEMLHEALQFRCIAMLLEEAGISCEAPLLERLAALARQGGRWNLSGAVYAVGKSGTLTIETVQLSEPLPVAIPLQMGENWLFSGFVLYARLETVSPAENVANIHKKFANACLDYDKIKGEIFLRPRQSGDRMQLSGRGFTSALKKLIQANLPPERRRTAHVLADADGVIFVEGVGCAARVCPDGETRRLLVLEILGKWCKLDAAVPSQ